MPAHASHVQRMTAGSASKRGAGLGSLKITLDDLSEEQPLLEVVREPGLLAALNRFLSGDRSLTALEVLRTLMGRESNPNSPTLQLCRTAIFYSPCFPSLKNLAGSGGTLELKQSAWAAILAVSRMDEDRLWEMLSSPGMFALLQAGLESADHSIAQKSAIITYNLCRDETTATAIFYSICFPSLKNLAASGVTLARKRCGMAAIQGVSYMEQDRLMEMLYSPGMVALLKAGLESADSCIAEYSTTTISNLCCDETTGSAIFDSPCFPSLKKLAASGITLERRRCGMVAIQAISCMEEGRRTDMLDSPGMVALLETGLESADSSIAEYSTTTISNLCCDETTASAVLDSHPDLVQGLAETFCNVGVSDKFRGKSQLHKTRLFPSHSN